MFKSLKCRDYLNVDQLPRPVKIFERTVNLFISEENLHDSIAVYALSLRMFLLFRMEIRAQVFMYLRSCFN